MPFCVRRIMPVNCSSSISLSGTCGVGLFSHFQNQLNPNPAYSLDKVTPRGGAGWQVAGFVNTHVCKEAYAILKKLYKIVMQSPKRHNYNSGNEFFFCVYDTRKPPWKGKRSGAPEPQLDLSPNDALAWPWKTQPREWR